jgi:hypothetical protein
MMANAIAAPAAPSVLNTAAPLTPVVANAGAPYGSHFLFPAAPGGGGSSAADSALKAFTDMPEWMKYATITTGMQGVSGLASGWFAGASAEEKLEFEKLVNAQREQQVQVQNKNAGYAPLLNFKNVAGPAGVLNA